ncbi:TRAP transporter large permease subunit [Pelagibius sp. Alg239-R121]|uniref:TRAP transporter large permease n=1 Tax=Pelagibius sp. Alg239-R121 TaxID=2993448 RepID=UPI0024A70C79|nr:TRAP transporter large permease subunit [Pelagibius sp. Alg239-R121]
MDLALLMFPVLLIAIFAGIPVAYSLMGVSLVFGILRFGDKAVFQFVTKVQDVSGNYVLAALPLFIFMGAMLEKSGIAERLFEVVHLWTRRLPGGLAVGTILMGVIFAAASGVVGATETVIGLLAIPIMMRHNYDKALISGTICSGGSLGTVIPPSVLVVILAPVADVSVGDLFAGILFPGLIMAGLFILYILGRCILDPAAAPYVEPEGPEPALLEKIGKTVIAMVPPVILIFMVLGTILLGWATATEAAACGAVGSIVLTMLYKNFSFGVLVTAFRQTLLITVMVLTILLAGNIFAGVFIASGGLGAMKSVLAAANLGDWGTLALILFLTFLAGFVLDLVSVILIIIPIAIPIIKIMGFDPIWFCILFLVVLQTSYLTPPMAPSIFYLRGISPPEITLGHMYRGVVPFIALEIITLLLVVFFPSLALWLPSQLIGF